MSDKLYDEIYEKLEDDYYHIYFEGDKENCLMEIENLFENEELTEEEYDSLLHYIEMVTEDIPDCIWEDMVICNPDLID